MKFEFAHENTGSTGRDLPMLGRHYLCQLSGCNYYLDLRQDVREWFRESGIPYKVEGVDPWGEGLRDKPFTLVVEDRHATLFKLRWL